MHPWLPTVAFKLCNRPPCSSGGEIKRSIVARQLPYTSSWFMTRAWRCVPRIQAILRASLLTSTYLQAMHIKQNKISYQASLKGGAYREEVRTSPTGGNMNT